jgi:hypothetical protein
VTARTITSNGIAPVPAIRRGGKRAAALAAGVAAVIAAGGYGVLQAVEPDTAEHQPVSAPVTRDDTRAIEQLRESLAKQYGTAPATVATPSAERLRELRDSLAAQYGGGESIPASGGR